MVVEDEVLIAHTIKLYLEERGHVFVDNAISFDEAVTQFELHKPDLVLLDVRLYGGKSGIDFANFLANNHTSTPYVFLTSQFDKSAIEKAQQTKPGGYLTKPIQKESLWTTVEVAYHNALDSKINLPTVLTIQDGAQTHLVSEDEILYIHAEHVYVNLFLAGGNQILSRLPLSQIMKTLTSNFFYQCHRSYIINTNYVKSWSNNAVKIEQEFIPISRSRRKELLEILENNT